MSPADATEPTSTVVARGRFGTDVAVRTRSALVLGLLVLAVTGIGGVAFTLFAAVLAALVFREWLDVTGCRRSLVVPGDLAVAAAAIVLAFAVFGMRVAVPGGMILMALVVMVDPKADRGAGARVWAGIGVVYAVLPAIALQSLREASMIGLWALIFLYAVVWSTDIAAFFAGRAIGGPRLMPIVSPKKTWSGALGGLCGALLAGSIVGFLAHVPQIGPVIGLAACCSIVAQAGDLFESWIKRCFLVKDSGRLIPGHGGVMDRVDGLIASALFLAIVGWSRAGFEQAAAGILNW